MGATPRYPYPKWVYSPAGGWWPQPKQWKTNTAIIGAGMALVVALVFQYSAENEVRHREPTGWVPSMMWSRWFKDREAQKQVKHE